MPGSSRGSERHGVTGVLAFGAAAFAVFCCAGLPLVVSLVGGLTLAGVLGVSAGILIVAAAMAAGVVVVRARHQRVGQPSATGESTSTTEAKP